MDSVSSDTNKSVTESIISAPLLLAKSAVKNIQAAASFSVTKTDRCQCHQRQAYQLLLINVNSVSSLTTGQNETWLLSGFGSCHKLVSVLSQRSCVREETSLCSTTVQLQIDQVFL